VRRGFTFAPAQVCCSSSRGNSSLVKELPDDLGAVGYAELAQQRAIRDAKIAPLFRRWPALSRSELRQLRRLYAERLRIARYLGRRRD
jgi:hypothetical protein